LGTPLDATTSQKKMATATDVAPDRRLQRDSAIIGVFDQPPSWLRLRHKAHLQCVAASARARHTGMQDDERGDVSPPKNRREQTSLKATAITPATTMIKPANSLSRSRMAVHFSSAADQFLLLG
jgi:hypothetical protein